MSIFATLAQKEPTIKSMEFITKRSMCDSNRGFTPQTLTLTPIQSHWNHTCRQWAETKWRYLISLFYASIKALCVAVNIALDIISSTAARVNCTQSTTLKKRHIEWDRICVLKFLARSNCFVDSACSERGGITIFYTVPVSI